jgi:hypothetical protein
MYGVDVGISVEYVLEEGIVDPNVESTWKTP